MRGRVVLMSNPDVNDHVLSLLPPLRAAGASLVVLANDPGRARRTLASRGHHDVRVIRRHTLLGILHFLAARWVFATHAFFRRLPSPPWQTLVNVWHGMPIKSVGTMDALVGQPPRSSSFTIASSDRFVPVMSRAMGLPPQRVLATGNPWTDRLVEPAAGRWARERLGVPEGARVVLHMPTFRRRVDGVGRVDGEVGSELVPSSPQEVASLASLLERHDAVWVSKPHPSALDHLPADLPANILVATDAALADADVTAYEVLACADVLVTDVSSVLIDFLVTDRPIVGWFPDLDTYREHRSLEFEPYEDTFPGPLCRTWPELVDALEQVLTSDPSGPARERLRSSVLRPEVGGHAEDLVRAVASRPGAFHVWLQRGRRISPGMLDQGVYAASNLALGVAVATAVTPAAFGQFNVLLALLVLVTGLARAATGEVLALPDVDEQDTAALGGSLALAVGFGALCGVVLLVLGPLAPWLPSGTSVIMALLLPGLLAQNQVRYVAFAQGRSGVALAMDAVWLLGTVAAAVLAPLVAGGDRRMPLLVLAWGVSALVGVVPGMRRLGIEWRFGQWRSFAADHWTRARPLVGEYLTVGGTGQIGIVLIGLAATVETVAALRGAHLVFGLLTVLIGGVVAVGVPEASRPEASGRRPSSRRAASLATATMALAATANYALLVVGGDDLGTRVLGDSWFLAAAVLLPVAVQKVAEGATSSAIMALRVQGRAAVGARVRGIGTVARVAAGVVAAALYGAIGAAVVMMAIGVVTAAWLWGTMQAGDHR